MIPGNPEWMACSSSSKVRLSDDEVHLWCIDLKNLKANIESMKDVLSQEESSRAKKFKFKRDSDKFTISHSILREILAGYLGIRPRMVSIVAGPNNKPEVRDETSSDGRLQFNISHSCDITLIAVTRDHRIGIDIERVDEEFPFQEVARRFFSKEELRYLKSFDGSTRREAFFRIWTWKEAYLKATGYGISENLKTSLLTPFPNGIPLGISQRQYVDGEEWTFVEISSIKNYLSTLVVEGSGILLRRFRWSDGQSQE